MTALPSFDISDVPFFPYPVQLSKEQDVYLVRNHLTRKPVRINRTSAEVLRMMDGKTTLEGIIMCLADRYPDAGGSTSILNSVDKLLRLFTAQELIWWRETTLEPMLIEPPMSIFWEITAACNLRCRHCVVAAGKRDQGELSTQRCLNLAEEMAEYGVTGIAFSGGEPMIHPDFRMLVQHVHNLGMMVQIATNGTLITPEIASWLKELGAEIQVSLDGSTPEIHNYLRPGSRAYEKTIDGIKMLVKAGHDITIGTVISRYNQHDIPSIVELAQTLNVARFRLIPFVPKGRGQAFIDMEVTPYDMRKITEYLRNLRGKVSIDIVSLEFEEMLDGTVCQMPLNLSQHIGCSGAIGYATITPTGQLLPCHFFEGVRADSVAETSFREVWIKSRFLNYFRHLSVADLHGACRECAWLPQCRGSCRAVNYAKGDLFGPNKQCWIAQESGQAYD